MSKSMKTTNKPVAVLISDVHYSVHNLALADKSVSLAIELANNLNVPLIVAGDLHDTKANLRGECVNAMLQTFRTCYQKIYVMIGNHDKINEKSAEHSLNFLREDNRVVIVDEPMTLPDSNFLLMIPYQHDPAEARKLAKAGSNYKVLIMHQGITGSNSGEYIQDKSAITKDDVAGLRVISGHYHTRQTIELPRGGKWDYIGNPYSLGFGEANDPEKGFQVLYDDGSLEFIPTNLPSHRIIRCGWDDMHGLFWGPILKIKDNEKLWIKVEGTKEQLNDVTKDWLRKQFHIPGDFRLELISTETTTKAPEKKNLSQADVLDHLIDSLTNTSDEGKTRLKSTWKNLCE
jgi:DNA repair exonuclease SbcCD nuclease subunit